MHWKLIKSDNPRISADLSVSGDYVISHRLNNFTVSYRPTGHHVPVGSFDTLAKAKRAAEKHAAAGSPMSGDIATALKSYGSENKMAAKKGAKKGAKKSGRKKASKKGTIPLKVLEKRWEHLGNILKRRGSKKV